MIGRKVNTIDKNTGANNVSYVMAGKAVNIKACGSHQHHLGLIAKSSEIRHYAYTQRCRAFKKYD